MLSICSWNARNRSSTPASAAKPSSGSALRTSAQRRLALHQERHQKRRVGLRDEPIALRGIPTLTHRRVLPRARLGLEHLGGHFAARERERSRPSLFFFSESVSEISPVSERLAAASVSFSVKPSSVGPAPPARTKRRAKSSTSPTCLEASATFVSAAFFFFAADAGRGAFGRRNVESRPASRGSRGGGSSVAAALGDASRRRN